MKLIIDIPEDEYNEICNGTFDIGGYFRMNLSNAFKNGTPLDDVKAEIQAKEMVETDVERQFYNMALADAIQILDNIGEESEEKPNE